MPPSARLAFSCGLLGLILTVLNQFSAQGLPDALSPAISRAGVLAGVLAVGLMLVGLLWTQAQPPPRDRVALAGREGLELDADLPEPLRQELAWGSTMLLTATPAATLRLVWDGRVLWRRGLLAEQAFQEGPISARARSQQQLISLVNLSLYPGAAEFSYLPEGVPAVLLYPLGQRGLLVLGGWAVRCFSRSDERWIQGWGERVRTALEALGA